MDISEKEDLRDEGMECDVCGKSHLTEECPELGLSTSKFIPQISRARLTAPHYLNPVEFPDGGIGVLALEPISNKTQFGPFEAKKTMREIDREDLFVLKILSKDGSSICLDASSEADCNWMALVQVASSEEEQNCMAYQLGIQIYFNTTRNLAVGDELKVWYAPQYAKKLGKSLVPDGKTRSMLGDSQFIEVEMEEEEPEERLEDTEMEDVGDPTIVTENPDDVEGDFTCNQCGQKFTSQFLFAKHIREHLFPVYNYSEGPPRRGRRPVPLKVTDHRTGFLGKSSLGRGRGRGRRGRPRGSGRRGRFIRTPVVEPGSIGLIPEPGGDSDEASEVNRVNIISAEDGSQLNEKNLREDTKPVIKRKRGRPRKVQPKVMEGESYVETHSVIGSLKADSVKKEIVETLVTNGSSSGLRRSSRSSWALKGLNKLGKWFKYPGEASSDEEPTSQVLTEGDQTKMPRKRLGIAMAASLRKAAMDEMTSPVAKKRSSTLTKSLITSPHKKIDGKNTAKSKLLFEKAVVLAEKLPEKTLPAAFNEESTVTVEESGGSESPKKYIVVTKGDTTTAYEIPTSFQQTPTSSFQLTSAITPATPVVTTPEPEESTSVVPMASSSALSTTSTIISVAISSPLKAEGVVEEESTEKLSEDDSGKIERQEVGKEDAEVAEVEGGEACEEVCEEEQAELTKNEGDTVVLVGTREEVVEVPQHERKNTIADLDGTDALTALVNAAISADKVPDPIAMVAADLYDERSLYEEDHDDYKAPNRISYRGETAEEGDESETDKQTPQRQRRKKRRRGDDPELEGLEGMTKIVEGPNGTEEFACGVCNKHFTQLKYLKLHLPAHTDRYRCKICGKRFARNESLLKHTCDDTANLVEQTIDEDGNDMFCCRECGRTFSHLNFATRHASMHRARFTCEKCGRTFLRQDLLEEHECMGGQLEEGEVSAERHECQICKQAFTNGKYLYRHMAMHTDIYKCEVCGKCYSRKDSLQRHISRCCPELAGEYSVHVCPNCKKTFGTALGLQNHTLNCGKYQCGSCKVAYFSIKDLAEHECAGKVLNEKASVQFPCKECNKTFASIAYLVRHEASHHDAFKCSLCKRVFIRKEELNWHTPVCSTRQKIQQEGKAPCEVCGEEFNEWLAFKEHHMTHTHPHKCEKCGKRFIKVGTLHNHKCEGQVDANGEASNLLSCEICKKTFKNERYLARHLSLHGQPEYSCEFCGKFFTRKDYLNDHQCRMPDGTTVRMVRKKNRLYIRDNLACPDCHKTFSSRSNMMKHMKVHGDKQAECHICHKRFHYENYLKLHIATVHEKQYQLQCNNCGKVLFSKTGLIAHIKQFHAETIKLYPCPKCGKTFRQKGNMKTHLISHTKERAFKCDVCNKAFKYPDQLNRHRLEHTLTEKFACEICDKQFVRTYELRNHMRNYHSGFVYVCGVCHECCAHRHTIIRHYKRKHPEVGNVFEEKPEFLDSLQKPVTADTQSRMMVENEDMKPSILRVGSRPREMVITQTQGSAHAYGPGEVILQQDGTGEILTESGQTVQQLVDGNDGEPAVFILKVMKHDENGVIQEMELTEDTKTHLAQLLQAHTAGRDTITHIQVGDQTLQIQREVENNEVVSDASGQLEFVHEIKFDPQQLEQLQNQGEVSGEVKMVEESVEGLVELAHPEQIVASAGAQGVDLVETVDQAMPGAVEVVEMEDGRLGHIIHMEVGTQMLQMGDVIQMEGGEVIQLDESQLMGMDEGDRVVVSSSANIHSSDFTSGQVRGMDSIPGLKVTKRRGSNGEIVVEVEGQADGQIMGLTQAISGAELDVAQDNIEILAATEGETESGIASDKQDEVKQDSVVSQLELQLTQGSLPSLPVTSASGLPDNVADTSSVLDKSGVDSTMNT